MKILIVGTGGVGGFYGGLLAKAGNDVTFLARSEHFRTIQESGLHVKSKVGDFVIQPAKVVSNISQATTPDLVLFCAKTYHTEELSKSLSTIAKPETVVISLQNGIDNDEIMQRYLIDSIIVPGIAYIVSAKTAPGLIEQTAGPRNIIFGSRNNKHKDVLDKIEKIMREAGIEANNSNQIEKNYGLISWIKSPLVA